MGSAPHGAPPDDLLGSTDFAPRDLTTLELAELFGVSDRTIRDLVARGVVTKTPRDTFNLRDAVRSYAGHLREVAAARGQGAGNASLTAERERVTREKADQLAIQNAKLRGELLSATAVEAAWIEICARVRARMLAAPNRCHQSLPHLTATDVATIDREIRDALAELGHAEQA